MIYAEEWMFMSSMRGSAGGCEFTRYPSKPPAYLL
jgi:hypothetical protein